MQTMKREDMEKEQKELLLNIGINVFRALRHASRLLGAVGRVDYLTEEINKVTPKPVAVPDLEKANA